MSLSYKQKAERLAAEMGVTLTVTSGAWSEVTGQAPTGSIFSGPGTHEVVASSDYLSPCWRAIYEDLADGIESCDEDDCDTCGEAQEVSA